MARNLGVTPPPSPDMEVWLSNSPHGYQMRLPRSMEGRGEWTAWYNLHSRAHMEQRYPSGLQFYQQQDGTRPIYTQLFWPDIPGCVVFPRSEIQQAFPLANGSPNRYFTCTVAWLLAKAIHEKCDRIELWGFGLADKPDRHNECYKFERPCVGYWIKQARDRGIEVAYQQEIAQLLANGLLEPGDPNTYKGELYGYDTRPEPNWDMALGDFI